MKKKRLFPVYLTYFLDIFGLAIVYPIFTPILLHPHALFSALSSVSRTLLIPLLIGIFPFAMLFGAPFIGQFSDRFGRKKAFFFSILGTATGYLLTAISLLYSSLVLLFISRLMTGLFASNLTLCLASIADCSLSHEVRTRNFGYIATLGGLSFILALSLGRYLSNMDPSIPFFLTAGINYLNFICLITLFHETHQRKPPEKIQLIKTLRHLFSVIASKDLSKIYLANFLFMFAWFATMNAFNKSLSLFSLSSNQITDVLILSGVVWVTGNFIINRALAKRFLPSKTLRVSLFFLLLILLSLALTENSSLFLLFFYPATCLAALCWTNSLANISLKAPKNIQGSILGVNQSLTSLASMLAPPFATLFADSSSPYLFTSLASLLSFLFLLYRK